MAIEVIRDWRGLAPGQTGAAVAIGAFDGVHRGHRAVIAAAHDAARASGAPLGVVTFTPHPRRWFQPDAAPFRLMSEAQLARALEAEGVDRLYLLPFDAEMAAMSDADFVDRVLVDGLAIAHAAVGFDFTYGRGRSGSPEALRLAGEQAGFTVSVTPRHDDPDGLKLSSSAVREAVHAGDMDRAAAILSRPFAIEGVVQRGDQRGRTIGVPTANIPLNDYMRPAFGVYATRTRLPDGRLIDGVASLGLNPMFPLAEPRLEVWLFDLDEDIYGQTLDTQLIAHLRSEADFADLETLKAQIAQDAEAARQALASA